MTSEVSRALHPQLIQINETEVIVPIRINREKVHNLKAVRVSDDEEVKIQVVQDYLAARELIPENTFASLFVYLFNYTFTALKREADQIAANEAQHR